MENLLDKNGNPYNKQSTQKQLQHIEKNLFECYLGSEDLLLLVKQGNIDLLKNIHRRICKALENGKSLSGTDNELYGLSVQYQIDYQPDQLENVKYFLPLSEQMRLVVLEHMSVYDICNIYPYQPTQAELNIIKQKENYDGFLNNIKGSRREQYITPELSLPSNLSTVALKHLQGDIHYLSFGGSYDCEKYYVLDTDTMGEWNTGTPNGYVFDSEQKGIELAAKYNERYQQIQILIAQQTREKNLKNEKYVIAFNVPYIKPIHSGKEDNLDVKGIRGNASASFTARFVQDLELEGSLDDIQVDKYHSFYKSSGGQDLYAFITQYCKQHDLPENKGYQVRFSDKEKIQGAWTEHVQSLKQECESLISIIKETNIDIENIKLNVSGNGCEWSVFVVLKPTQDGFVYQYSSTQERYASKSYASALQFLNNRNIKNILNSDDYKREHEKYIEEQASKDLPSVN